MKKKLIRITTVPISLEKLLENQLKYMKDFYEVTAVSSDKERLDKFGEEQGINIFHIELTRKITPIKDIKAVIKLYRFLRKEKPFIVHTHTPKAGIVGMLASFLARVPNRLHTVAGLPLLEAQGIKREILNFVEKLTYSCATNVYPNSYGLNDVILNNKFTKKNKLKVIGNGSSNGIDTSYFNPEIYSHEDKQILKESLDISDKDFVFIFVGRVVKDKGITELVVAFDRLTKNKEHVKLVMVGDYEKELDPLSDTTENIIEQNKSIISVGYQSDVRPYFSISDVLVFPSYREGFPNVVMQASAMRLPSIVTDINGCNEIIKSGVNGVLIPAKDEESLYNEMKKKYETSEDTLRKMGEVSRKEMKDKYERHIVWDTLLKEYKSLENV